MKTISVNDSTRLMRVDDEDYNKVSMYEWYAEFSSIYTNINGDKIYIGTFILGKKDGYEVDHKDRNFFNNQRSNLRYATHSQNCMNRIRKNRSGFRGVYWIEKEKRWISQITIEGKRITIGRFDTKEEAARMYNLNAESLFGEFAILNKL